MRHDDLRRIQRVNVCCRVDVRDQFGIWTAVTEDVSARGCRIVTAKLPRVGSLLELSISSDLFPESLDVSAQVTWISDERVGAHFLERAGHPHRGALSPAEWVVRVIEHGRVLGPEPLGSTLPRVLPVVVRRSGAAAAQEARREASSTRDDAGEGTVLVLPIGQR